LTNFHKIDIFQSTISNHFSWGLYIPIINQQSSIVNRMGGGADISSFFRQEARGQQETFVKYMQSQE
jgi:hypothetical protein